MNRIGVDIAKQVFQLHWVEPETDEIVALQLEREKGDVNQTSRGSRRDVSFFRTCLADVVLRHPYSRVDPP